MSLLTRPRSIAAGVGACLAIAGIAFAAVSLSTEIGGSTAIADSSASFTVSSVTTSGLSGGMTCTGGINSGHTIVLDAVAKRFNNVIKTQGCDVTAVVHNSGDTPITVTNMTLNAGSALNGWTVTPQSADPTVPAGGNATYKAHVSTGTAAGVASVGTGSFTGTLVGTAADGQ